LLVSYAFVKTTLHTLKSKIKTNFLQEKVNKPIKILHYLSITIASCKGIELAGHANNI
jgi:hypothetical protein